MTQTDQPDTEVRMSLGEHLEELRRRLVYALLGVGGGLVVGLVFAKEIILLLEIPYKRATLNLGTPAGQLAVLSAGGGFDLYMRTGLWCGVVLAGPWIIYQIWAFVAAGLLPREKKVVHFAVPCFAVLFLAGVAFFAFLVAVPAITFLLYFDRLLDVTTVVTLQSHLGFMAEMMIVFGLAFQTPLIVLVLARIGLVSMKGLNKYRRHVIVGLSAFAAIFAPADALSMVVMAVSMWLLYELGVALAYFLAFRKRPAAEAEERQEGQGQV